MTVFFLPVQVKASIHYNLYYSENDLNIEKNPDFDVVTLRNLSLTYDDYTPRIPYRDITLIIPENCIAESIKVSTGEEVKLESNFNLKKYTPPYN